MLSVNKKWFNICTNNLLLYLHFLILLTSIKSYQDLIFDGVFDRWTNRWTGVGWRSSLIAFHLRLGSSAQASILSKKSITESRNRTQLSISSLSCRRSSTVFSLFPSWILFILPFKKSSVLSIDYFLRQPRSGKVLRQGTGRSGLNSSVATTASNCERYIHRRYLPDW